MALERWDWKLSTHQAYRAKCRALEKIKGATITQYHHNKRHNIKVNWYKTSIVQLTDWDVPDIHVHVALLFDNSSILVKGVPLGQWILIFRR